MTENLNKCEDAVIKVAHFLRCGNGPALEHFAYTSLDQNTQQPKTSDIGGHHIAFFDVAIQHVT